MSLHIRQVLAKLQGLTIFGIELDGIGDCVEGFREPGFHTECCGQIHPGFGKTGRGPSGQTEVLFCGTVISIA